MVRVNLLPHRQIKRAERQRQFNLMLAATAIAAAALVFMGQGYISSQIDSQASRNSRLEAANAKLDKEIAEIKDLKNQINSVLERKQVVENLQSDRSQAVVVLDEITRQLPEGMYLKSIKQKDKTITLEGVADTNARVATLVRNLSTSAWLESPRLIEIKAATVNNARVNNFTLTVNLKKLKTEEAAQPPGKSKK
ncbi:MAG TPA: PilN domain-containing protein [Methylophilaceae bacterium]|nr:PilN domain-containing protein [Methylophilaceae bacterium]